MTATNTKQASSFDASQGNGVSLQAARERIALYTLLATLMRTPPATELLAELATVELPAEQSEDPDLVTAWRQLRTSAKTADPEAVDDEFHQLFIGLSRGEILPYASWYLSGFLMDRPLVALRSDLARLGIARSDDNKEPEDHVAALFESMALLADPAEGVSLESQRHFFLMHLTPWTGRLFSDMAKAESANFYTAVARLGTAFLDVERSWLDLPE